MPFQKGHKKMGGIKKGTTHALTHSVKDAVKAAFDLLQQDKDANLFAWGKRNPNDFYKVAAKLIPAAVELAGKDGEKLEGIVVKVIGSKSDAKGD
jgi:hypothetical protein